ncbi:VIT1/CCC1 transporter family protein, partial [Mesorhizobium japonicum]|uniref:VIT1/CCC1 transporter family protein n=1 Tax=Mesorhizobium japonicum TaxID=2066070 RepID=UPI003B5C3AB5
AVFGINDGLISNMSLILGIVGANSEPRFIILAGVAGLLAGACSMGAGEYISVRSQREVFEYQIAIEKQELEEYPEEEMEELSLIYQARGVPLD